MTQVDSKVKAEDKDDSVLPANKDGNREKSLTKKEADASKHEGAKPSTESGPTKSKDEPLAKVNSIPGKSEKGPEVRDSREKKEERNIKTADGVKSRLP